MKDYPNMVPQMREDAAWSFGGAKEILDSKGLTSELPEIAAAYQTHGGGNQNMAARAERLDPFGWEQEISFTFRASTGDGTKTRRGDFDAYKDSVLVEHEKGEQMRANWHLLKMEAAYRDPEGLPGNRSVEAGALLIPSNVNFPTLERTKTDVEVVLCNYFDFSIPLFVWQYPTNE